MSSEEPAPAKGTNSASSLVGNYLAEHCATLLARDRTLRPDDDDGVHGTRVAIRRIRSTLRVFEELFEPGPAGHLDRELRWWASVLGPVRDLQVLQDRLDAMVDGDDETLLMAPAKALIDDELARDREEHWAHVQEALSSERHGALRDDVARWGARPVWATTATLPATELTSMVRLAEHEVGRRLQRASRSGDLDEMHRARKAAKRARYGAEVAAPVIGRGARKTAHRYQRLQDLLGEHRDSLVSAQLLRRLGAAADATAGVDGFAFGILFEREQRRAQKALDAARRIARRHS